MNAIARTTLLVLWVGLPLAASAQTQRSGDANARAMQQLQQLSAERVQLKSENDKLKQELQTTKDQLKSITATQASLQQRLKTAEAGAARDASGSQGNAEALEKLRAQMQELVTRFRETAQSLKDVEADRNTARGALQVSERELNTCVKRNQEFYQLNTEVLDRLENKSAWGALTSKEPFTQLQRTRLENLIEGYKDRATDLRTQPNTGSNLQLAK